MSLFTIFGLLLPTEAQKLYEQLAACRATLSNSLNEARTQQARMQRQMAELLERRDQDKAAIMRLEGLITAQQRQLATARMQLMYYNDMESAAGAINRTTEPIQSSEHGYEQEEGGDDHDLP